MRWLHLCVVVVFALVLLIFVLQNRDVVTLTFLGFSTRAPVAILIAGVYLIGAITGGSLFALLRRSYKGAQRAGS
jgi:lipopolysaccharide assembly protein A